MRSTLSMLRVAVCLVFALTLLAGVVFPAALWGIAQAAFPSRANGSLVVQGGHVIGSRLIGQAFIGAGYFHPRPSAAGTGYDGLASGGSNLGPTNQKLIRNVGEALAAYRAENALPANADVPVDAVTGSGSGLDPEISVDNARLQAPRVARVRGLAPSLVAAMIDAHTETPSLGVFGEPGVNVLMLNLALDSAAPAGLQTRAR